MRFVAGVVTVFIMGLFMTTQVVSAADPPKGFRNLKWGDPPPVTLKKFSGPTDGVTMYVPSGGKKPQDLYDVPVAEEAYYFSKAGLYSADAWIDGKENYDKMKRALTKAFGDPAFSNEKSNIYKWKWPNRKIEIQLYYQVKFSRTSVTFSNKGI